MSKKREAKSPYARHNKSPFKYSEHYHSWASAVARDGFLSDAAQEADRRFRKAFNVPFTGSRRDLSEFVL